MRRRRQRRDLDRHPLRALSRTADRAQTAGAIGYPPPVPRPAVWRYAWISVAAALVTIALKFWAWRMSGSVGMGGDAAEGLVNLVAAGTTLLLVRWASQPEDDDHPWGHGKAEHLAAAFEGVLILVAALGIVGAAVDRLLHPHPLTGLGWSVGLTGLATLINGVVGTYLIRVGHRHQSAALEADGHHLLTDVWTSLGVIGGVALVAWTGQVWVDAACALAVAISIGWTSYSILRKAASGLLDERLEPAEELSIRAVLDRYRGDGIQIHAVRTRRSGPMRFVTMHVLVPGEWTVTRGHDVCERLEQDLEALFDQAHALTHLEPLEAEESHADQGLSRPRVHPVTLV